MELYYKIVSGIIIFLTICTSGCIFINPDKQQEPEKNITYEIPSASSAIYLTDFGIKADGSDETAKLKSAFDHVRSHSIKAVIFPANKVIGINDYIETPENIELVGNGCTIRLVDRSTINHEQGFFYIHDNCYVHDLKFDGNMWNQTGRGVNERPDATNGVMLYNNVRFERNELFNIGAYTLFTYKGDSILINNNVIHDTWQYGIATGGDATDYSENLTITNNTIFNCGEVGIKLRYCSNSLVSQNIITIPDAQGISAIGIHLYSNDGPNNHIKIINNTLSGSEGAGYSTGIGSDDENNKDIEITGNLVKSVYKGIAIFFENASVHDNTIIDSRFTGILLRSDNGKFLRNNLTNAGMIINDDDSKGKSLSNNLIMNNLIKGGNQYWRAQGTGIFIWYTTNSNIIEGNNISVDGNDIKITKNFGVSTGTKIKNNILYSKTRWIFDDGMSTEISNNTQLLSFESNLHFI
jgi:parallel beta-helix repeat protein